MIDPRKLPPKVLVDTGVFFRFLGDRPSDGESQDCIDFCNAMIANGRPIMVAAPTLAEVTRYRAARVPRYKGITVVPFDERAAELLGLNMDMVKISHTSDKTGRSKTFLKYDALIAACALRCGTKTIVALDDDHVDMAKEIGIHVAHPSDFRQDFVQFGLFDALKPNA